MSDDDTRFNIVLEEEVDGDAELKFDINGTNYSGEEQQESLIDVDISGSLVVLVDMIQVYHGTLTKGGSPATLIVMKFEFQPGGNHRRFKSVDATMTFSKGSNSSTGPEVVNIAPEGAWSLFKSKIPEEISHEVSSSIEGGGLAKGRLAYAWAFKKTKVEENSARIIGARRALGLDRSRKNTARWTLLENPSTKSGIPTLVQTAILLKRERTEENPKGEMFKATLEIHGETDKVTWWKDLLKRIGASVRGKVEKNEDVIFNPKTNRGVVKDENNLKDEDLTVFQKVVTLQEWKDGDPEPEVKEPSEKKAPDEEAADEETEGEEDED